MRATLIEMGIGFAVGALSGAAFVGITYHQARTRYRRTFGF